jgi:hypothetical protein
MAYEYSPNSARFEIPNPHRIENIFFWSCAVVALSVGLFVLLEFKSAFLVHDYMKSSKCVLVGIGLLGYAFFCARFAMRQARFFFGRGEPADLVPHLEKEQSGHGSFSTHGYQLQDARALRDTIRGNAIDYGIPREPLDNLLYALVRDLIYSPQLTQRLMRTQFRSVLSLVFLLACFVASLMGLRGGAADAWIGVLYLGITTALVLRPLSSGSSSPRSLSEGAVILFIVCSIIGPVLLAAVVPPTGTPCMAVSISRG